MTGRVKLLGTWKSEKGNIWIVKKSYDRFLSIEFHIVTFYKDFGFNSDFIWPDDWNRFDPESFLDLVDRFKLVKLKEVKQ